MDQKEKREVWSNFSNEKNDRIDNAAFELICSLAALQGKDYVAEVLPVTWDMELIGELADFAEELLNKSKIPVCRPFYEGDEETPCYLGTDCKRKDCLFRKGENQ